MLSNVFFAINYNTSGEKCWIYIPKKGFPVNHNAICHSDTLEMFVNTIDNGGTDNPKMR